MNKFEICKTYEITIVKKIIENDYSNFCVIPSGHFTRVSTLAEDTGYYDDPVPPPAMYFNDIDDMEEFRYFKVLKALRALHCYITDKNINNTFIIMDPEEIHNIVIDILNYYVVDIRVLNPIKIELYPDKNYYEIYTSDGELFKVKLII